MHFRNQLAMLLPPAGLNKLVCLPSDQFESLRASMERKVGRRSNRRPCPPAALHSLLAAEHHALWLTGLPPTLLPAELYLRH